MENKMISFYAITYRRLDYLQKSLDSILAKAGNALDVTVVESESRPLIRTYLADKVADESIDRALCFKNNVRGMGLVKAIELYPPKGKFFVLTDLDLIVPEDMYWLAETIQAHKEGHLLTSFPLSLDNYVPPNGGHSDNGFGCWLMGIDTNTFLRAYPKDWNIIDGRIIKLCSEYGTVKRLDHAGKLYHLSWDLWKDDPEYFSQKVRENGAVPQLIDRKLLEDYTCIEK